MILAKHLALAAALILGSGLFASSAQAGYVVTLQELGTDVVATGSGPIDLTGLAFAQESLWGGEIFPSIAYIISGPVTLLPTRSYIGLTGPASFGDGGTTFPSSGSGDIVGIMLSGLELIVPVGYASGDPLSDSSTYANATFSSLGVTPGTYEWTWGTGANQNFTLVIGSPESSRIPEPASAALLGVALAGLLLLHTVGRIQPYA
jgi:hypothetical protein